MAYEAEVLTDRMLRHAQTKGKDAPRVTRLGSQEVGSALRTQEKGSRNRVDILTYVKGWTLTLKAKLYRMDGSKPEQVVTLLENVSLDRLFQDQSLVRRSPGGRLLPALLPGEPDLID